MSTTAASAGSEISQAGAATAHARITENWPAHESLMAKPPKLKPSDWPRWTERDQELMVDLANDLRDVGRSLGVTLPVQKKVDRIIERVQRKINVGRSTR